MPSSAQYAAPTSRSERWGARARSSSRPSDLDRRAEARLERRLAGELRHLLAGLRHHEAAGPHDLEVRLQGLGHFRPETRGLALKRQGLGGGEARGGGELAEVVGEELDVKGPRVVARRMGVRLVALDEDDVDALARELPGGRDADDPGPDDDDARLRVGPGGLSGNRAPRSAGRQRLPLVVVAPFGLLAGEGEGRYRLHRKTRREEPVRVGRFIAGGRAPRGDSRPAVAPLAASHPGAGEALERPRLVGARRNARPKRFRRDRFAATDRDLVADEAGKVRRCREERPESVLKPPGAVPPPAGAPPERLERGREGTAEVARGGESGEGAFRKGRVRSAHSRSIAGHEYAGEGGLRVVVPDDREAPHIGVPAMLAAEEPRELGRGMEAVSHAHRVHVEGPLAPRFDVAVRVDPGEDGSPHPFVVVFDPDEDVPMEHRNAPARKGRAVADPPYDEFRRVAERGKHRPRPDNGRRRRLGHRHDFDPSRRKLARHLEVERPVAGDEHPRARGDPIGASQGLGCARRHDPGKGPAGNRMRPLVRPGGDDELTRADTARAAADEDLDFRRCRVRIVASAGPTDRVGAPHRGGADDLHPRGPHPLDEVGPRSRTADPARGARQSDGSGRAA